MAAFVEWMAEAEDALHPVVRASEAHRRIVFYPSIIDGNVSVVRLLMNLCLLLRAYTLAVVSPIFRGEYIHLLERAHTDAEPFTEFIANRVLVMQKVFLRMLGQHQKKVKAMVNRVILADMGLEERLEG